MADYSKRGGGKRFGAGSKPGFAKKSWGDNRSSGPVTHHKATCSKCGKACEVPFKPVSGKPVFCRDCFVKTGDTGGGRAGDKYQKREHKPRRYSTSAPEEASKDVLIKLEEIQRTLERIVRTVEASEKSGNRS